MMELSPVQKLDEILRVMQGFNDRASFKNIEEKIIGLSIQIPLSEISSILQKLINDEFVDRI